MGYTYDKMDADIVASKNSAVKLTTHGYPVQLIYNELKSKVTDNGFLARQVRDKIKALRTARVESDYHNVVVTFDKSKAALTLSEDIIKIVKQKL
jgi:hypothetical protein